MDLRLIVSNTWINIAAKTAMLYELIVSQTWMNIAAAISGVAAKTATLQTIPPLANVAAAMDHYSHYGPSTGCYESATKHD